VLSCSSDIRFDETGAAMTGISADSPNPTYRATLPTPNSTSSFWHSEPSETLLGHCTTKYLPTAADVVIVGSGIAGTLAAWTLLGDEGIGHGKQVVLLEAREACWGATGRVSQLSLSSIHLI